MFLRKADEERVKKACRTSRGARRGLGSEVGSPPVEEILKMIHEAYSKFIQRPGFILRQIARTLSSRYRMEVVINNLSRIGAIRDSIYNII